MKKITKLSEKMTKTRPMIDESREMGYFRAYFDGYRWNNTVWPVNNDNFTMELAAEFDEVLDAFRRAFKDIRTMRKWCVENAQQAEDYDTFYAYYEGKLGTYWFRMITRRGDYNLYLHCYNKM